MRDQAASERLARKARTHCITMVHDSNTSHIGSALSIVDILAVLYQEVMTVNPEDPSDPERDRFILSKGHACSALYAVLAEKGFFSPAELQMYHENGSRLLGHATTIVPGVEFSTGSLGHGACVACGMAFIAKHDGCRGRVYALVGDGECEEGCIWEMALFARKHKLNNLIVIVDRNNLQGLGCCDDISSLNDLAKKWRAFGWDVEDVNGHDHAQLKESLMRERDSENPLCVIAHTVKGKGISYMEDRVEWHYRSPQGELYEQALAELSEGTKQV